MENKILIEPLRERVFLLTSDGYLTFADSRAIMVSTDDLYSCSSKKPHIINTRKFLVLEHGDMLPFDKEDSRVMSFTKSEFEQNTRQREQVLKILYDYISDFYDPEEDFEMLVNEVQELLKEMGYYNIGEYNNDIVRIFTSAFENEKQDLNSQGVKDG